MHHLNVLTSQVRCFLAVRSKALEKNASPNFLPILYVLEEKCTLVQFINFQWKEMLGVIKYTLRKFWQRSRKKLSILHSNLLNNGKIS